jgi:hypothetical protein
VSNEGEWKERCGRPAEEKGDRVGEEGPDPAEVRLHIAVEVQLSVALGGERAGEEDTEEKEDDAADLARQRGFGRPIVPGPARAL